MSRSLLFVFALGLLAASPVASAAAAPGDTTLVSRDADGQPGGSADARGDSGAPSISADGRLVAFTSTAPNMVAGVGGTQVYVRDLSSATTVLASRMDGIDGAPAQHVGGGQISADGRYVAFSAEVGGVTDELLRRDLQTDRTDVVSRADGPDGAPVPGNPTGASTMSADGRYVLFTTTGPVLDPTVPAQDYETYMRDTVAGRTVLVSRASGADGAPADGTQNGATGISPGGRFVAFRSDADNLGVINDPALGYPPQVFLRDVRYGRTFPVSRTDGATGGPVPVSWTGTTPVLAGGCRVAFDATGASIAPGSPANGGTESYVRDICAGTTRLVSRADGPTGAAAAVTTPSGPDSAVTTQAMSGDGRYVAFTARASNLAPNAPRGLPEVYVRDLQDGRTILVSRAQGADGAPDSDTTTHYGEAALTADARFAAFDSAGTHLVGEDTHTWGQVYRRDLGPQPAGTPVAACGAADDPGLGGPPAALCTTADPPPSTPSDPGIVTPQRPTVTVTTTSPTTSPSAPGDPTAPIQTQTPLLVAPPLLRAVTATQTAVTAVVDRPARVSVTIARAHTARRRRHGHVVSTTRYVAAGHASAVAASAGRVRVGFRALAAGRYRLTVSAAATAGARSPAVVRALVVHYRPKHHR